MFVQNIETEEQQRSFLALAKAVMRADGRIHEMETTFLRELDRQTPGVCADDCNEYDLDSLSELFSDTRSRASMLFELIGMALVNEDYATEQRKLILEVASRLNISEDSYEEMEGWVTSLLNFMKQAEKFMVD